MKNLIKILFSLFVGAFFASTLWAAYPNKPVGLVVAYGPGGATDFQARIVTLGAGNKDFLGQPIVIFNRPGAGGKTGWNYFASKAKKDGYDLAAYNVPHFIAQSIVFDTKYNINNLEPIANWGADPAVLIVNKNSQFQTVKDLINYAKKNPNKVTVSGAGLYVGHHIAYLQLARAANVKLKYVPHSGGVAALKSVLGGQVMAGFNNLSDSFRSQNELKILAVADLQRNEEFLPDVPTFKEEGVDIDDSSVNFRGIMVRKGTDKEALAKLTKAVPEMFNFPRALQKMKAGGSPVRVLNHEQVKAMWQERESYLRELLKDL
jgi:tripartite-type tricarboxylate transporter receptor subunit TctC